MAVNPFYSDELEDFDFQQFYSGSGVQDDSHPGLQTVEGYHFMIEPHLLVCVTPRVLDIRLPSVFIRRQDAGANVIFSGTTRDNFQGRKVMSLSYSAYEKRALQTMWDIGQEMKQKHSLNAIAIIHRLGEVTIREESIYVAVSTPHRRAAWRAGEETLELVKSKVEIWKQEKFEDGSEWRANRDGVNGVPINA